MTQQHQTSGHPAAEEIEEKDMETKGHGDQLAGAVKKVTQAGGDADDKSTKDALMTDVDESISRDSQGGQRRN